MQWVCLLTDWGLNDPYVAELKARLWTELPDAHILDITHTSPRHDLYSAAYILADFFPYTPPESIHIVGINDISPNLEETSHVVVRVDDRYIIGTDNSLFPLFFFLLGKKPQYIIKIATYQHYEDISVLTSPARDLFAKVAGMVAKGEIGEIGTPMEHLQSMQMSGAFLRLLAERGPDGSQIGLRLVGKILFVDGFGNVVSDITRQKYNECVRQYPDITLSLKKQRVPQAAVVDFYPAVEEGDVAMIFLKNDLLEISVNQGSCAKLYGLRRGDEVQLVFKDAPAKPLKL